MNINITKYIPEVLLTCWWFNFAIGAPYKNSSVLIIGIPLVYICALFYSELAIGVENFA